MSNLRLPIAAVLLLAVLVACANGPASSAPTSASASASASGVTQVNVVLTNAGCVPDRSSVPAGAVTFNAVNEGGDAVSEVELMQGERILGESEHIAPGLSGTFTLQLQPGTYVVFCPGATTPQTPFEVTGN